MENKELEQTSMNLFTGERFIPGIADDQLSIEHFQRYNWVLPLVKDKSVVDIACGEGYGSNKMAYYAKNVIGIDISNETIERAQKKYIHSNLTYQQGDIENIPVPDHSVDILVSFETIEHVDAIQQNKFLKEAYRVLKADGMLVISTPNKEIYSDKYNYHNEYHKKEFYKEDFYEFLNSEFKYIQIFQQYEEVSNIIVAEQTMVDQATFYKDGQKDAKYYIAIASNTSLDISSPAVIRNRKNNEYEYCIDRILELQKEEISRNEHIAKLDAEIDKKNERIVELQEEVANKNLYISILENKQEQLIEQIEQLKNKHEHLTKRNEQFDNKNEQLIEQIEQLQNKNDEISQALRDKQRENEDILKAYEMTMDEKCEIENNLKAFEFDKNKLEQTIRNKEGHIELLLESERELMRIKQSRSWNLMSVMWKLASVILPPNSKRRLFGGIMLKFITHPIRFLRACSLRKLKNFFRYLKEDGVNFVSKRIEESLVGNEIIVEPLSLASVKELNNDSIGDYETIIFSKVENPKVSIIIPVYNQFEYTYLCLKSIYDNTNDVTYEIIIADDNSSDFTTNIELVAKNIRVVRNEQNLRFLKNCNNASKFASGEYIFFLNNDTQVQENWLKPLIDLIESSSDIGMVGSKLVYADGRLQEAGGILWSDGSAWNYGNRSDPSNPEYNYVKEVDYISGAAIMLSKKLWDEIDGFDERFIPAYCEDSDLAFEVRKRGYKVMYQPLSVVVHFEGVSNGTDTNSGQKAFQTVNQKKFYEKWKNVLDRDHFPNAVNVFQARDKSSQKKVLLMVDHYVPQYDKDAGSRTVFQYLKLFVDMGFNVKFIGDNFYKHEPYTTVLQQMGIEVLYGPYYAENWKTWIKENSEYIDYVFLNRPHISVKYIDYIRNNTNAKIIYYGHDLHFLRERRKYELTGDKRALSDSADWKQKEISLMKKVDVVYYPSQIEVDEIAKIDSSIVARAIVAYIFDEVDERPYSYDNRKDIMFVGGFTHTPNIDAVVWLYESILPLVLEKKPDIKFYIMGSNPPESVLKLNSENFIIKGFVSDEELAEFYETCRLDIVPLRYGAGIKGKVIEGMKYGIPIITTSVGAEGIIGSEDILCIEDDAKEIANKIISLYDDVEKLDEMSKGSYGYIKNNYSPNNAKSIILMDFSME